MNAKHTNPNRQRGAVLMISAVMLIVIAMLTMSVMGIARMETRMATNEEFRVAALQSAQSSNEAIIGNPSTTPVIGGPGYKLCTVGLSGCDQESLIMPTTEMTLLVTEGYLSAVAFSRGTRVSQPSAWFGVEPGQIYLNDLHHSVDL